MHDYHMSYFSIICNITLKFILCNWHKQYIVKLKYMEITRNNQIYKP